MFASRSVRTNASFNFRERRARVVAQKVHVRNVIVSNVVVRSSPVNKFFHRTGTQSLEQDVRSSPVKEFEFISNKLSSNKDKPQ